MAYTRVFKEPTTVYKMWAGEGKSIKNGSRAA